ncbi:MAG: Crp/Fnr family transcriptional regulator [Halothece sp. Uz-M2-17]|nr:Crp/Fnr family transcriptional regulator [Halothece sp. Uz-M2-17]
MMSAEQNPFPTQPLSFTKEARFSQGQHLPICQNWAWLIETGVVKTYTWNEQGNTIILGYWGKGELVGQALSVVSPYQVECCTPVKAQQVPATLWSSWGECLSQRCQQSEELLFIHRCDPLQERLRLFLVWLAHKFGQPVKEGWKICFKLTHQELADAIGSSRVTVTRLLRTLEQQGIIKRFGRNCIVVKE